jgi:XrtN system VIT domain protein
MEKQGKELRKDVTFLVGVALVLLSLGIFCLPGIIPGTIMRDPAFGVFFLNFILSIIYFIIVWIREKSSFRSLFQQKVEYGFIHLLLCLISAYSLNREIPVFEKSTGWLQVFLVVQGIILFLPFVKHRFPAWLQFVFWLFLGVIFSLFLYLAIYLVPIYPAGIIAAPALGISLHAFIPLWFTIALVLYLVRNDNRTGRNIAGFFGGILICIFISILYVVQWNHTTAIISKAGDRSLLDEKNDLPEWVVIAQQMPRRPITEKILKTGLVYSIAPEGGDWELFDLPNRNFDEVRKHDPLVMMATFFLGKPALTDEQKIKILEALYDSRHKAQERLWRGDDLQTSHILTNVRLYPNLRLAYTEKIISVRNRHPNGGWMPGQEAIYTFHLPEGAVVTSLSLWINGREEKAILTTKGKADTAYRSIVGIERRDPSLVRWQEGNTVSVRVFPCTPDEDRRFKIGITSPLRKETDRLLYENIWFDGPVPFQAQESIKILTMDNPEGMVLPAGFTEEAANTWIYEGKHLADWQLKMPVIPLKANAFTFDGKTYQVSEYDKAYQSFNPDDIYLDINSQWTRPEFDRIRKLASAKNIYVFQGQRIKITDGNADRLFGQLVKVNFSVFPFYEIARPEKSLLITKGDMNSPNVSDMDGSMFNTRLKAYIKDEQKGRVFNLGQDLSPYIKTLKELRAFDYDFGSIDYLSDLLNENRFIVNQENPETVVINDAGIKITETADTAGVSNAPDHVMRLFSYNRVMYSTGMHYFEPDFFDQSIQDKAYKSYIVSPVTSLVVLETQADYKRFGIADDGKSLKNASMNSSGAVPEPHEWLLIAILAGIAGYLYLKGRRKLAIKHN